MAMICKFYGANASLTDISPICRPTNEGISLLGMANCAKAIGFEALPCRAKLTSLLHYDSPCIIHWNHNHFVVLYKIKHNIFYIADPSKGLYKCTLKEFTKYWAICGSPHDYAGFVLLLKPTEDFDLFRKKFNNCDSLHSFKYILGYLSLYKKHILHIFSGLALGCILQLILPFLTQSIVDIGIRHNDIKFIWLILLGELMIVIGKTATDFIRRWLLLHISMRINLSLVSDFFIKLLKLPMSFFDTKLMGDLMQRIGDHSRVQSFLTNHVIGAIFSFMTFIVLGGVLLIYNRVIFVVFLSGSMVYGLWMLMFLKKRRLLDYELFAQQAVNQNKTFQFITAMQEIKLQNCEKRRRWEWEDNQANIYSLQMVSLKLQQSQEAGCIFISEVRNIVITVLAATAVINGQLTLGTMLAIQYIIGQLNSPIEQIMSLIYALQDVKISLERINDIHKEKNEDDNCGKLEIVGRKNIVLSNVQFKYNPDAVKETLSNISFVIPEGKVTAIVGASGSGKTTLMKLILGYYRTQNGSISISGHNINDYDLKWWRKQCGVVMQDGVIFSESIARNIAVEDGEYDIKRVENAARLANLHDFIMSLPLNYNTQIGHDGLSLSQGQKQRILIARAVYKSPDFVFFDEATNALDANNEKCIVEHLEEFFRGRTVVVIAHRLSTVRNADKIVVINAGEIVECGDHGSLLQRKGAYYNLVKNQLELGN